MRVRLPAFVLLAVELISAAIIAFSVASCERGASEITADIIETEASDEVSVIFAPTESAASKDEPIAEPQSASDDPESTSDESETEAARDDSAALSPDDVETDASTTAETSVSLTEDASYHDSQSVTSEDEPAVSAPELDAARSLALTYLKNSLQAPAYGREWTIIALCSGGEMNAAAREAYLSSVADTVSTKLSGGERSPASALDKHKATENARVILALLAVGADPTDIGGYDLVSALCDVDWVCSGTLNCPIYALTALDASGKGHDAEKNALVDYVLDAQLKDGGWALSGDKADSDVTAMALQALCRHRDRSDVIASAARALDVLSRLQLDTGEYRSWGRVNSESISQVVIALCAWGIDPASDARFVKNETSALEALLGYITEDGFADTKPGSSIANAGETNLMATEQASLALSAYELFASGGGSIYDFK